MLHLVAAIGVFVSQYLLLASEGRFVNLYLLVGVRRGASRGWVLDTFFYCDGGLLTGRGLVSDTWFLGRIYLDINNGLPSGFWIFMSLRRGC